jgi:hypothetical protein
MESMLSEQTRVQMKAPRELVIAGEMAADELSRENVVQLVVCPGDGCRYEFVVVDLDATTDIQVPAGSYTENGLLVTLLPHGQSAVVAREGLMVPSYAAEKFGLGGYESEVVAEFVSSMRKAGV